MQKINIWIQNVSKGHSSGTNKMLWEHKKRKLLLTLACVRVAFTEKVTFELALKDESDI